MLHCLAHLDSPLSRRNLGYICQARFVGVPVSRPHALLAGKDQHLLSNRMQSVDCAHDWSVRGNAHQDFNSNRLSFPHCWLELPLAERQARRFVHWGQQAPVDMDQIHRSILSNQSLEKNKLRCILRWQRQTPKVEPEFGVAWQQPWFELYYSRLAGGRNPRTFVFKLAKLQRPAFARHLQENRIDFPAVQGAVNIEAPAPHRPSRNDKSILPWQNGSWHSIDHVRRQHWIGCTGISAGSSGDTQYSGSPCLSATATRLSSSQARARVAPGSGAAPRVRCSPGDATWRSGTSSSRRNGNFCPAIAGRQNKQWGRQ